MRRANQQKREHNCESGAEETPSEPSEWMTVHVPSNQK
jgi:hypothetical protein